jgi:DNA-binding LacI/PurR family transcriptional regulator
LAIPDSEQAVRRKVDQIFDTFRPDAIIAENGDSAAQLIRELSRRQIRVPEDVAVIGHENQLLSH